MLWRDTEFRHGIELRSSIARKIQTEHASKIEGWGGSEWTGLTLVQGEALLQKARNETFLFDRSKDLRLHIPVRRGRVGPSQPFYPAQFLPQEDSVTSHPSLIRILTAEYVVTRWSLRTSREFPQSLAALEVQSLPKETNRSSGRWAGSFSAICCKRPPPRSICSRFQLPPKPFIPGQIRYGMLGIHFYGGLPDSTFAQGPQRRS
jgi:hypothetical protein